jgi:uncharacterized repeat protein (TIGR02543 family)
MAVMNMRQWRKAYMIEFLKNNNEVEDVFTFSVPPESESLEFPQRVTETPTFGGVVFDDYGNDTVKIRLTGSTINEEWKLIYRGNTKLPDYLTGEKEIFKLQELFDKWGSLENPDFASKKVYLYDLSKMNLLQIGAGIPTRNYWRVVNKGLKIKRAKDKPFTFNYELELIGIVDESYTPAQILFAGFDNILDGIQKVIAFIETIAEITEETANAIDTLIQQIIDVKKFVDKLQDGDWKKNTEVIMRKFPVGNSLWNAAKAVLDTADKIKDLPETLSSQTGGSTNYSRYDSFTVSFNSGGGSYVASERVAYGNCAKRPAADPVLAKYRFLGWYTDPVEGELFEFATELITKNRTLYARWERVQATVTYNSRQGSAVLPVTVDIGETAVPPEPPARQGYVFEHWCTDMAATSEFNFAIPIIGDITLYARWRAAFTVSFNSNGGTPIPPQTVNTGEKIIYPLIPERKNYLFGIWCADSALNTEFNFDTPVSNNITLYAKWIRITNDVTFNSNGGSAVPAQTVNIGGKANKPPDPVKDGHTFQRWCSDEGLTQEFLFYSVSVNYPMTLYAKWLTDVYTVHFEPNGGAALPDQSVNYQALAIYPPVPTKPGALFLRWCSDEELETEFDFSAPITGNITLYAKWHEGTGV